MMYIYRYHTFIRRLVFLSWIDFVVFLSAAILFNFYIAFDGPFLPATYRLRSINFRVCRYSGLSFLLDFVITTTTTTTILRPQFSFFWTSILSRSLTSLKSPTNSSKLNSGKKRLLRESISRWENFAVTIHCRSHKRTRAPKKYKNKFKKHKRFEIWLLSP